MQKKCTLPSTSVSGIVLGLSLATQAESFSEALTQGKASGDIHIRYESVEQDNALDDATALTMRTRIGYTTGTVNRFSAMAEFEDVSIIAGINDYSVPQTGFKTGEYSVIADPEVTELEQGFLMYKSGKFSAKLGRQIITYDNHRFVGHVGWRQDRQTFDALTFLFDPSATVKLSYSYLGQRNRIFAEALDMDSKDHLLNANVKLVGRLYTMILLLT